LVDGLGAEVPGGELFEAGALVALGEVAGAELFEERRESRHEDPSVVRVMGLSVAAELVRQRRSRGFGG
jgi:hypothetical protein